MVDGLPIIQAAVVPAVVLLLGRLDVLSDDTAMWLSMAVGAPPTGRPRCVRRLDGLGVPVVDVRVRDRDRRGRCRRRRDQARARTLTRTAGWNRRARSFVTMGHDPSNRAVAGTGARDLAPGDEQRLGIVGGTASCDASLGYALPADRYEVGVAVDVVVRSVLTDDETSLQTTHLISDPAPLVVTP